MGSLVHLVLYCWGMGKAWTPKAKEKMVNVCAYDWVYAGAKRSQAVDRSHQTYRILDLTQVNPIFSILIQLLFLSFLLLITY